MKDPTALRPRTRLEITLMCLLARRASTGAGLVSILRDFPIGGHGQSPGAVYPALHRLEEAGFVDGRLRRPGRRRICGRTRRGHPGRYYPQKRHREYALTFRGIDELRAWAGSPVTRADMLERPDFLLLRYLMIPGLVGEFALRRFAVEYETVAVEVARDTQRYMSWFGRETMSPWVRSALTLTVDLLRTRSAWARAVGNAGRIERGRSRVDGERGAGQSLASGSRSPSRGSRAPTRTRSAPGGLNRPR